MLAFLSKSPLKCYNKSMPKLLLHICCAPCATYISLERLKPRFDLTWYFYNPNLNSLEEYEKRLAAVKFVAAKYSIPLMVEPYEHAVWQAKISGCENAPECGERCRICYAQRLEKTARLADAQGFDFFATSLSLSPYKDKETIRGLGRALGGAFKTQFLDEDFQANNGYTKSQALAKELGLYRQKFCGCEYSLSPSLKTAK